MEASISPDQLIKFLLSIGIPLITTYVSIKKYIDSKYAKKEVVEKELKIRDEKIKGLEKIVNLHESHLCEIRTNVSDIKNFLMGKNERN